MIEFLICFGAFVIILLFVRLGMKAGGFLALAGMLAAVFGLLVSLRYWFVASRFVNTYEKDSIPLIAVVVFWVVFTGASLIFKKLRENYTDTFEFVHPSLVDNALGAIFGFVTGAVFAMALMMTLTIAASQYWPAYKPGALPLPIDRWPLQAYRFVETRIIGVSQADAAHTLLPVLEGADAQNPASFWK